MRDMSKWFQFYASDMIGDMTYSKRHGFLEKNEDVDGIIDYLSRLFCCVAPVCLVVFALLTHLPMVNLCT